jgi:hypothetical protein
MYFKFPTSAIHGGMLMTHKVRFQVLKTASMKMCVFWDFAPCSLVEINQRFRSAYCLNDQGDEEAARKMGTGRTSQELTFFCDVKTGSEESVWKNILA